MSARERKKESYGSKINSYESFWVVDAWKEKLTYWTPCTYDEGNKI
jgi:hypothetical protein